MNTFLFYDLETSGLSPCFDQVYQFAGIRTDLSFNEMARYEFLVKPTLDTIPAPEAMITHRLPLSWMQEEGESEASAIASIHQLLNEPGTISLGYNTLGFDDEFLRFNFYRHLKTPYTHQFANACRRMDLFPMTMFYYLFRPDMLKWRTTEEGKISLKLEHLSEDNALAQGQAHHAMVDVEATLALAKIFAKDTKMWDYLMNYFIKEEDLARLAKLPTVSIGDVRYPHGIMLDTKLGSLKSYQAPAVCLGQHWHYKNQSAWIRLDDERLLLGDLALIPELWAIKKKAGEPPFFLLPEPRFHRMDAERQALGQEVLSYLAQNPSFFKAIQESVLDFTFPKHPETDVEAALYLKGFLSSQETAQLAHFHDLEPKAQAQFRSSWRNSDLSELSLRYLGRFHEDALNAADQACFREYLARIWDEAMPPVLDYQLKPKLTRQAALARIESLKTERTLDEEQKQVLKDLEAYFLKA